MIYVDRSQVPVPEVLRSERAEAARQRIIELLTRSSEKHLAQLRITLDQAILSQVTPSLLPLFHQKCAFCESFITTTQPGDVEHYRPKGGAEDLNNNRAHLHYCWLGYEWDNLLLVCIDCNRRRMHGDKLVGKADLFPVEGNRARLLSSIEVCRRVEVPLILDPCFDKPEEHLTFDSSGQAIAKTKRGKATIEILGLNTREQLVRARANTWQHVATAYKNLISRLMILPGFEGQEDARLVEQMRELFTPNNSYLAVRWAAFNSFKEALSKRNIAIADPAPNVGAPKKIADKKALPAFAYQRVRRIEVRNFNGIEALDLEVPSAPTGEGGIPGALMILGENATGKSSVLDAVALALLGTEQIERLKLDGTRFLRRDSLVDPKDKPKKPAEVRVLFEEESKEVRLRIDLSGKFSGNARPAAVLLGYGPRRFFAENAAYRSAQAERIKSMFDPLVTLANPKQWLLDCSEEHFALAVRALRTLLLLPDEALVKRLPENSKSKTHVVFQLEGRIESIDTLSEGYKTIVAMGVDIMREMLDYWVDLESAHGIVLVDELDTHLHPRWKMRIAQRLRHALPQVQFLASTHDPLCLRGYHDGEVVVLRRDADARVEQVINLPSVRGLSVQQLLTSEYFGLWSAEDPALEERLARFVTLASKRNRTSEEDVELNRQRVEADAKIKLGSTPEDQLVQRALTDYLVQRRISPQADKVDIERASAQKLVDLWDELDKKSGVDAFTTPRRQQ